MTGGYIFNALAGGNVDAVENEGDTLDVCLSHPTPNSEFHYHFWSPCFKKNKGWWSDTASPPLCRDTDFCTTSTAVFSRQQGSSSQESAYTASNWDDVIGIARDGHVIIGPYKEDGSNWQCDRDVCNGTFIDGQYVYVGSDQFPYVVGCWGPGPAPLYQPGCTSNGCGSLESAATSLIAAQIGALASAVAISSLTLM